MKLALFAFTFALSLLYHHPASAQEQAWACPWPNDIRDTSGVGIAADPSTTVRAEDQLLRTYAGRVDFDIAAFGKSIGTLEAIGRSTEVDPAIRSEAFRIAAGLYGRVSDKLRSMASIPCGKSAILLQKRALQLNPRNDAAIIGYAKTIKGMSASKNSGFIEFSLRINLEKEAKAALGHLENLQNPPADTDEVRQALTAYIERSR